MKEKSIVIAKTEISPQTYRAYESFKLLTVAKQSKIIARLKELLSHE